jgi:hypothetical protein
MGVAATVEGDLTLVVAEPQEVIIEKVVLVSLLQVIMQVCSA